MSPGDRLGWTQQAADATELASFQFALYVDGGARRFRRELHARGQRGIRLQRHAAD